MLLNTLRRIKYYHVGRMHHQTIKYCVKQCQEFDLLFGSNEEKIEKTDKYVNNNVVNRLFVGCLFSRIIGNNFPLSIYLSQNAIFHKDILIGQEVRGQIEVIKDLGKNKYEIKTICKNKDEQIVVQGIAIILQE